MSDPIDDVLKELAETAQYVRETARLTRESVEHLVATEERIEKMNAYMGVVIERIDKAINGALRAREQRDES